MTAPFQSFFFCVVKWQKVFRIQMTLCVTGQKIRSKKFLLKHWTVTRSVKKKKRKKAISFLENDSDKNSSGRINLTNRLHVAVHLFSNRSQKMSKCGKNISDILLKLLPCVPLFCSYHILSSSVIYYWTDTWQHGIYLLNWSWISP